MDIIIKDPVEPITHRSTFELEVVAMHGDADAYTTESQVGFTKEQLIETLKILEVFFKLDHDDSCDSEEVLKAINALEVDPSLLEDQEPHDVYTDLVGYDVAYRSGGLAKPDVIKVYWYDENGIKHNTEIVDMVLSHWGN